MSKVVNLELFDGSGGLNNRDPASGIAKNEWQRLVNYHVDEKALLRKRWGQELIQYAPIDPQVYPVDASTIAHYSFDEDTSVGNQIPVVDTGPNNFDLAGYTASSASAPSAKGVLPVSGPKGRVAVGYQQVLPLEPALTVVGTMLSSSVGTLLNGKTQLTWRGWVNIPETFNGRPFQAPGAPVVLSMTLSGTPLFSTHSFNPSGGEPYRFVNGFKLWRDWDSVSNANSSAPYVTFDLNTSGVPGTVTRVTSGPIPTGAMQELKVTYDSSTGLLELSVTGRVHDIKFVNGGGAIDDTGAAYLCAFGGEEVYQGGVFNSLWHSAVGVILDEWEIAGTIRSGNPFKVPRGQPMILEKADGTLQLLAAAEEGLYYTVGDSNWTKITDTDPAPGVGLLSAVADWDGACYADRLYMTNGINTPLTWDGQRLVPTGEGVVPMTLSLAASGTTNTNGLKQYAYAYKYGDDVTGLSPIAEITVAGNFDVNMTAIPTRHDNCDSILIYKTKAGGETFFLCREIPNDPTVDSIDLSGIWNDGGAPDADSGADGVPDGATATNLNDDADYVQIETRVLTAAIRKNRFYLPEHNRLFGIGSFDFPYDYSWSALGNPDVFRATAFGTVSGDRGPLIGMASSHGEIVLSKNAKATAVLRGTDESNWTLTENIHPKVGARDHWSYVHRYPVDNNGPYILCFVGADGVYVYAGQQISKISDKINPTFESLAVNSSTKLDWITTDQVEFQQAASFGGATTQNVQQSRYETDGLREFAGDIRIVNQLDYLGLWSGDAPLVSGKVLWTCKGPLEGEFFFSTDADSKLYRTLDNFVTASVAIDLDVSGDTPAANGQSMRIIEIIRRASDEYYFLFTDKDNGSGGSGGGSVYAWDQTAGVGFQIYTATGLFYETDTLWRIAVEGVQSANVNTLTDGFIDGNARNFRTPNTNIYWLGNVLELSDSRGKNNIYYNHAQRLRLDMVNTSNALMTLLSNPSLTGISNPSRVEIGVSTGYLQSHPAGFYSLRDVAIQTLASLYFSGSTSYATSFFYSRASDGFTVDFTNREYAMWKGGTFRPQAFWDATNSKLWFTASSAEDSNGNRTTSVYSLTQAGVLAAISTASGNITLSTGPAGEAYFIDSAFDSGLGFNPSLKRITLSTSAVTTILQLARNFSFLRMTYNSQSGRFLVSGKSFNVSTRNSYQYTGFLGGLSVLGDFTSLDTYALNEASGAFPMEIAAQTTTPYAYLVAMQNIQASEPTALYTVAKEASVPSDVGVLKNDAYEGLNVSAPVTGIISNLLFVASSDVSGNNLWSDRIYWYGPAALSVDGRVIQLGIPGTWKVQGGFTSRQNQLGTFGAFGNFGVEYSGNVSYFFRNAVDQASLAASERPVSPNQPIQGFYPTQSWAQWRSLLTWDYSVALPLESPSISVVDGAYFIGVSTVPRVVAEHWEGRTYFSVARTGQPDNDLVLVLNKVNTWEIYEGWSIKGMKLFRGYLAAFQRYELVKLESGPTDLGGIINAIARTGALASGEMVAIDDMEANVKATINDDDPNQPGHIKVTPYIGDDAGVFPRMLELPVSATEEVRRVHGEPLDDFGWDWGQVYSIEIKTSDETTGDFVPFPKQYETIQKLDLKLLSRPVSREYTGK